MAHLKVRIVLNKGRHGAPLAKLGRISEQAERFLRSLTSESGLETKPAEWLASNFTNGSIEYDAEFAGDANGGVADRFVHNLEFLTDFDPSTGGLNGVVSEATALEYAKIGTLIDPDEVVGLGIYPSNGGSIRWRQITYQRTAHIRRQLESPLLSHGSLQGVIHAWFKEARDPNFQLRELGTDGLVRVYYPGDMYSEVARAVQQRTTTVIVTGMISYDRSSRTAVELKMSDLKLIPIVSTAEFETFFGIAPAFVPPEDDDGVADLYG